MLQSKYEECMAELDTNQTGQIKQISKQNQSYIDELLKQQTDIRSENVELKEMIRNMKKQRLVNSYVQNQ